MVIWKQSCWANDMKSLSWQVVKQGLGGRMALDMWAHVLNQLHKKHTPTDSNFPGHLVSPTHYSWPSVEKSNPDPRRELCFELFLPNLHMKESGLNQWLPLLQGWASVFILKRERKKSLIKVWPSRHKKFIVAHTRVTHKISFSSNHQVVGIIHMSVIGHMGKITLLMSCFQNGLRGAWQGKGIIRKPHRKCGWPSCGVMYNLDLFPCLVGRSYSIRKATWMMD